MKTTTRTGQLKTDKRTLAKIGTEFSEKLLQYRKLNKLVSTYVEPFLEKMDSYGRLHGSFNQSGTVTGRFSSSRPNLQNVAARTEEGHKIRECFIPDKGFKLIVADMSQIELRVLSHFCQEPKLLKAYCEDSDLHTQTAQLIFGIKEPSKEQRFVGKTINFSITYGIGPNALHEVIQSENKSFTLEDTTKAISSFFSGYPGIKTWMNAKIEETRRKGYIETLFGNRIPIANIGSRNEYYRSSAEREAISYTIQGSTAEIIKKAMVDLVKVNPEVRLLCQIHDELIVESFNVESEAKELKHAMENAVQLKGLPTKVEVKVCNNWGDK